MAEKKKKKKKGFWAKLAERHISRSHSVQDGNELFLLSEVEIQTLKDIRKRTFIRAGIAGALGVLVLYLPYHYWGETLFPIRPIPIPENPIYNGTFDLEIEFMVFSVVLVMIEIWYLTYINIKAVSGIAHVCGHPNPTDENYKHNLNALVAVGLERKQKQLEGIGINPYEGLSKTGVIIFQFLLRLKATASNMVFRIVVKKALGRYALRLVLDLVGIPVYAFWNIWGSRRVINEARIRVMAPPLIKRCTSLILEDQKDNPEFKEHIYDTLQLISESKRSFHYNHFLLSITVLEEFGIELEEEPEYNKSFLKQIPTLTDQTRKGVQQLFIFGIMIDGRISRKERRAIHYLIEKGVLPYEETDILKWADDYFDGRGIEEYFAQT